MINWEDITKDDCVLCILRDKYTKKAKRYEWVPNNRVEVEERIKEINQTRKNEYYEICDDEEFRTLLPLPLSQRQRDINDIFQWLRDIGQDLRYRESEISQMRNLIDEMNEKLDEYVRTYAREGE